jgi:hypothetical protein
LHNDHHEKVKNLKKPRPQWKVAKWLCKMCSMCENMTICVKIWLSMDIFVKYAQCVKIWPSVWKFDFQQIYVWNMLNVWKYDHLCENLTFIGYLCERCSMFENMTICVKIWLLLDICVKYAEVCAVYEVLCSVSDGHYTESGNSSISDKEKGRHTLWGHVSYLRKRETCPWNARLPFS